MTNINCMFFKKPYFCAHIEAPKGLFKTPKCIEVCSTDPRCKTCSLKIQHKRPEYDK